MPKWLKDVLKDLFAPLNELMNTIRAGSTVVERSLHDHVAAGSNPKSNKLCRDEKLYHHSVTIARWYQ